MQVVVGLSGGVDSSVAALLLKDEGHEVIGVTMCLWDEGVYAGGYRDACFGANEADDVLAAKAFCQRFEIPYHTFDCADDFSQKIITNFREEYLAGRTPNPCVRCNALMKFGLLPQRARAAGISFDRYATGHYARTDHGNGRYRLLRARDETKDQSYFLYRLSQAQLQHQLFPLGNRTKAEVRRLAQEYGIEVAEKPDSQDFYSGEHSELLETPERPGNIVDESGKVLGQHNGYWNFTIGQRKGLGISNPRPLYVIGIVSQRNEVIVGTVEQTICRRLIAGACNWISIEAPEKTLDVEIKVRSAGSPKPGVSLHPLGQGRYEAHLGAGITGVAPGQSAVFYEDEVVLGGGIIEEAE